MKIFGVQKFQNQKPNQQGQLWLNEEDNSQSKKKNKNIHNGDKQKIKICFPILILDC